MINGISEQLIAHKMFWDYMDTNDNIPTEPEHFVEQWLYMNVRYVSKRVKIRLWRCFIRDLVIHSGDSEL